MRRISTVLICSFLGLMSLVGTSARVQAQGWPTRDVHWILPFGAGSATDIGARLLAQELQSKWGRSVVIENRPGGDGLIAIRGFLQADDDHTMLFASSASFISHPYTLNEKVPYDFKKDFGLIARVADTLLVYAAPTEMNVGSLQDWLAQVKKRPERFTAAGAAGLPEMTLKAFLKQSAPDIVNVPYKNIVQAGADLAEGRIHLLATSYAVVRPYVQAGKVKVLVIGASERSSITPGVPTAVESGFPILSLETTSGLYGNAKMPEHLRKKISADVIEVVRMPAVAQRLTETGQTPNAQGPADLMKALLDQEKRAAAAAKVLGIVMRN